MQDDERNGDRQVPKEMQAHLRQTGLLAHGDQPWRHLAPRQGEDNRRRTHDGHLPRRPRSQHIDNQANNNHNERRTR